jgi:hypothetical protein
MGCAKVVVLSLQTAVFGLQLSNALFQLLKLALLPFSESSLGYSILLSTTLFAKSVRDIMI